ncbi:MAG TPA: DUF2252 family protein [Actinomycetota bacterium]|nr:DUF2252 family protein [Actinomycetota bacterium]
MAASRHETEEAPPRVRHLTWEERAARGKAARKTVPRESHVELDPNNRPDPIALLEEQAVTRVPELVPIRYGRMSSTPFAFFRGAALIMSADLAGTPTTGIKAQLCGDAHIGNFGMFASPERHLVFDINDFDETNPGPWEWDVKRLAASVEIAARGVEFTEAECRAAVLAAVRGYREAMRGFARQTNLEVWYAHLDVEEVIQSAEQEAAADPARVKLLERTIAKFRTRDNLHVFAKLTDETGGEPRIVSQPPLIVPIAELIGPGQAKELQQRIAAVIRRYRRSLQSDRQHLVEQYRFVDLARKVVGVGSVGTRAWIVLMLGNDPNDPLFLQIKEAEASVLERFVGRSAVANHGQRVVGGQRLMQATSDIFLGWDRTEGIDGDTRDFYFRQLKDWKGSIGAEMLLPAGFSVYAGLCGWTLARAHARSGDRVAIATYLGKSDAFDKTIAKFAAVYADRNERDHQALLDAIEAGRVKAETGV